MTPLLTVSVRILLLTVIEVPSLRRTVKVLITGSDVVHLSTPLDSNPDVDVGLPEDTLLAVIIFAVLCRVRRRVAVSRPFTPVVHLTTVVLVKVTRQDL